MNNFKVLNKNIYSSEQVSIVPIRFKDRYDNMHWKNEQIYHLRQDKPLTKKVQDKYFENIIEEVKSAYQNIGRSFDCIYCVLPTAPLLTINNLVKGYELLLTNKDADSVRPIVQFSYPIQRAVRMERNRVTMFDEKHYRTRSQDLEPAYHDAGQYYWMNAEKGLSGEVKL